MKTFAQQRKEAKQAPKFILKAIDRDIYIAEEQESIFDCTLTDSKEQAMQFSVGFDNPDMKKAAWTYASKMQLEIIYL